MRDLRTEVVEAAKAWREARSKCDRWAGADSFAALNAASRALEDAVDALAASSPAVRWQCPKCGSGRVYLKCQFCGWTYAPPAAPAPRPEETRPMLCPVHLVPLDADGRCPISRTHFAAAATRPEETPDG